MIRMIVSLPERDKKWLEQSGRRQGVSASAVVRGAIVCLRNAAPASQFQAAVRACAGAWKSVRTDSQKVVNNLRKDWEGRP